MEGPCEQALVNPGNRLLMKVRVVRRPRQCCHTLVELRGGETCRLAGDLEQMHVTCAAKEKPLEMPFPEKEKVLDAVSSTEALRDVVDELLLDGVLKTVHIGETSTYGLAMPVSVIRRPP
jgi:hypothetical protein